MSFATATKVVRRNPHTWMARVHPGWDIFGVPNGGYLMVMLARAMEAETNGRDLITLTTHFLRPAEPGPVAITVDEIKVGRTLSTLRATMLQDGKELVTAVAAFADPRRPLPDTQMTDSSPPHLPPPEECVLAEPSKTGPFPPPFTGQIVLRIHPDDAVFFNGDPTGIARIRGWFRLQEGDPPDPLSPLLAADAFPPAVFNANLPLNWTPTVEMTTHLRDSQPRTWLKCSFHTRFVTHGLLEEDGEIWDEEGNLVALSRQLALVPR
ncbi:MAG: thioesterase family protein [Acidimicrobiia bacterium]